VKLQIPLNLGDIQPKGVQVTIRGRGELLLVSQYKVAQLTPDDRPSLDQVQHLLDEHVQEGWELVTALQFEGAVGQPVDQMIRSLSNTASTIFIFKRAA